ncbi:MAG: EVE domain-containing protein [Bacteroidia bacterium]|nr:EVE domain-containing protein [Bacteroidia bacterium]MDW8089030.1 EVE domain-containing protein [Bacteroidia bacterium]
MYWLVKSEPEVYSFAQLLAEGQAIWDGVRNPQAQRYLRQMQVGEAVLYYHTGRERAIVGLARVRQAAFPEPGYPGYWAVELEGVRPLRRPVTLAIIRTQPQFQGIPLLRQPRLSVMPIPEALWEWVLEWERSG